MKNVFAKKKEIEVLKAPVMDANLSDEKNKKAVEPIEPELTQEQKDIVVHYKNFRQNFEVHDASDIASVPDAVFRAEILNLLFSISYELKLLREQLAEMGEDE